MNLIEKLGGYDKAKEHRDYLISYGSEFGNVSTQEVDSLNDALLKHRRENNIFEVGDIVVFTKMFTNDSRILTILNIDKCCSKLSNGWNIQNDMLRHATPEEIKAGHRL